MVYCNCYLIMTGEYNWCLQGPNAFLVSFLLTWKLCQNMYISHQFDLFFMQALISRWSSGDTEVVSCSKCCLCTSQTMWSPSYFCLVSVCYYCIFGLCYVACAIDNLIYTIRCGEMFHLFGLGVVKGASIFSLVVVKCFLEYVKGASSFSEVFCNFRDIIICCISHDHYFQMISLLASNLTPTIRSAY